MEGLFTEKKVTPFPEFRPCTQPSKDYLGSHSMHGVDEGQ